MSLLLERLIEERARSDIEFIASALAGPSEMPGDVEACLKIMRAAAQVLLKELQRVADEGPQLAGCPKSEQPEPNSEDEP